MLLKCFARFILCAFALVFSAMAAETTPKPTKADVVFAEAGGESLALDAYLPDGAGPFPVCILVHGGGWTAGTKTTLITPLFEPLRSAGFVVFSINYRLAPKFIFPACAEDVDTAIRWVKAHAGEYKGDPKRVALVGESAGGYLVTYAATNGAEKENIIAVVAFYPPTDLESRVRASNKLGTAGALLGLTEINDAAYEKMHKASPVNSIRAKMPPFFIVHGDNDAKVPFEQSVIFQKKMREAGNVCELLTIPGGGHGMNTWKDPETPNFKEQVAKWLAGVMK